MTTTDKISDRIRRWKRGAVFTPADFLDLGSREAVDQALSRLARRGQVRRIARGLYDLPRVSPRLGVLSPDPALVARALARSSGGVLQMTGARAANVLGLSTQVPAQTEYLTTGPSRTVRLGKRVITLKHASPRTLVAPGSPSGDVVQALRFLGPAEAEQAVSRLSSTLPPGERRKLARVAPKAPAWMRPALTRLAAS